MIASETTRALLGDADALYARLLHGSGYGEAAIARVLRVDPVIVAWAAWRDGWVRYTPARPGAVIGVHVPVLIRCDECGGRHGEALHRPPRPCPHCGRERLVLL